MSKPSVTNIKNLSPTVMNFIDSIFRPQKIVPAIQRIIYGNEVHYLRDIMQPLLTIKVSTKQK
jgi:hypothetical protein